MSPYSEFWVWYVTLFSTSLRVCNKYWIPINLSIEKKNVIPGFSKNLSGELRMITLLITEFYCIDFTHLIIKISRFVLYYLTSFISFRFNYDIVGIFIYFLKLYSDTETWDSWVLLKWLSLYELCYIKTKYWNLFWIFWVKIIIIVIK